MNDLQLSSFEIRSTNIGELIAGDITPYGVSFEDTAPARSLAGVSQLSRLGYVAIIDEELRFQLINQQSFVWLDRTREVWHSNAQHVH